MEALAGVLQEGVLPLVPSLLHDDGPMALHAIKLLGALLGADLPRWMPQFQRYDPNGASWQVFHRPHAGWVQAGASGDG